MTASQLMTKIELLHKIDECLDKQCEIKKQLIRIQSGIDKSDYSTVYSCLEEEQTKINKLEIELRKLLSKEAK